MPPRKAISTKRIKKSDPLRFTPDDIVRAIKGVEEAGLQVYSVEITRTGAINIRTAPFPEAPAASPDKKASSNHQDEAEPTRKKA
jgi:hypothetical protein